jgi:hypothetical protein
MASGIRPANLAGLTGLCLAAIPWAIMGVMAWLKPD